jgi:uncharacterized membrane protein
VTWIGLLYNFNFVQGGFFSEIEAGVKSVAIQKLVPRALWWFRWGAFWTMLTGILILTGKGHQAGFEIYSTSWGVAILTGATLGLIMGANVWFIIWPCQKKVIANATATASGGGAIPGAAEAGARSGVASRTNTLISIPLLFLMGAASHLPIGVAPDANFTLLAIVLAIIIGAIELNAIKGKTGPMTKVSGVIHLGLVLTIVLYAVIEIIV